MGLLLLGGREGAAAAGNEIVPWSPAQEKCAKPGAEPRAQETRMAPERMCWASSCQQEAPVEL